MKLSGWGRYPVADCRVETLRRTQDLGRLFNNSESLIARGNGRSYGDAAINPDLTLSMLAHDRMHAFDAETGLLVCDAGVMLADILRLFVPRGWLPPVMPGTKFVTIGGMIASDVHGKNHHHDGTFGNHLEWVDLVDGAGQVRRCSATENTALFEATIGGMGLTGIILTAAFRLRPIETAYWREETIATRDLDETMSSFEESADWPYSVAWIDCLASGGDLGKALLSRATPAAVDELSGKFAAAPLVPAKSSSLSMPINAPSFLLNRMTVSAFNALYYRRGRARAGERITHFDPFFFPLDKILSWNRLYGRKGFVQYQCVLPQDQSRAGLVALLDAIAASGQGSFLAVLKLLGEGAAGLMSFPMAGYTLALDFPMRKGTLALLERLDRITHNHGGRVYLAKDARLSRDSLAEGYSALAEFSEIREAVQTSSTRFESGLSRRLAL